MQNHEQKTQNNENLPDHDFKLTFIAFYRFKEIYQSSGNFKPFLISQLGSYPFLEEFIGSSEPYLDMVLFEETDLSSFTLDIINSGTGEILSVIIDRGYGISEYQTELLLFQYHLSEQLFEVYILEKSSQQPEQLLAFFRAGSFNDQIDEYLSGSF